MSETTRFSPNDTFTFWHAVELVKKCFLPILIVVVLTFLPAVAAMVIHWQGQTVSSAAREAALAESLPDAKDFFGEQAAESLADDAYTEAYEPYKIASTCVKLISWLYTPWLTIGLIRGLLSCLRGGECTVRSLLSARKRWKTALWLAVLTGLCSAATAFAGTILMAGLSAVLGIIGAIVSLIVFVIGMYWVELHLLLTECHLADDTEEIYTATDCIRYSWQDMKEYGLFPALCILWPVYLVTEALPLVLGFFPALPVLDVVSLLLQMVCTGLIYAACAGIYVEIRRGPEAAASSGAYSDGLARARALAAGEPADN